MVFIGFLLTNADVSVFEDANEFVMAELATSSAGLPGAEHGRYRRGSAPTHVTA